MNNKVYVACLPYFPYNYSSVISKIKSSSKNIKKYKGDRIMAEEGKTYACPICGQEVQVVKSGVGTLVCCNRPMKPKSE